MSTSTDTVLESLGKLFVSGLLLALQLVARGWAISTLWNWFIAPLDAPRLGIVSAIGLSMAVSLFIFDWSKAIRESKIDTRDFSEKMGESFGISVLGYPITVGIGYLVHRML